MHIMPMPEDEGSCVDAIMHGGDSCSQGSYDDSEVVESEYPDIHMLISSNGESIADICAGIRDALEKLNKIVYQMSKK